MTLLPHALAPLRTNEITGEMRLTNTERRSLSVGLTNEIAAFISEAIRNHPQNSDVSRLLILQRYNDHILSLVETIHTFVEELSGMKDFIANDMAGIMSVLRFIPGAQIPLMLAQLAAGAYMGAKPEDLLKQAAVSLVSSNMDKLLPAALQQVGILDKPVWDDYLGKFIGGTPTTDLGKLALKAGSSGLASLVQSGGDLEQALKSSGIALLGDQISGLIPKGDIAGINYSKLFDIFAPSIARGEVTNADVFRFISSLAQEEARKKKPPTGG
jgi:hypothetical protein